MNADKTLLEITSLADGEIKEDRSEDDLLNRINNDLTLTFHYGVQIIVSKTLKNTLIKYPVPFKLRKKLIKVLESAKDISVQIK